MRRLYPSVTARSLVTWLDQLQPTVANDELAIIRIRANDARVDWNSFGTHRACALPGAPVGQRADHRFHGCNGRGLHVQEFEAGYVDVHLDSVDPCRDPVGHGIADTRAAEGALVGAGILLFLALVTKTSVLPMVGLGASAGGLMGACVPKRQPRVFELDKLLAPMPLFA